MKLHLTIIIYFFYTLLFSQPIFVYPDATGSNDGSSWTNAFINLQSALASTQYGDTLWVAKGTYYPTTSTNRSVYFQIPNGVALYGGFAGVETALSERDWENNETILSGDIGIIGDTTDNVYTVIYIVNADDSTVVDGITITGGNADITNNNVPPMDPSRSGGGIYVSGIEDVETAPLIRNCIIKGNQASMRGGGIAFYSPNASGHIRARLQDCLFEHNYSKFGGGAVGFFAFTVTEDPSVIDHCDFLNNKTAMEGGAIFVWTLDPSDQDLFLTNNYFESNTARSATCLYIEFFFGNLLMSGCTIHNNAHSSISTNDASSVIETGLAEGFISIFEDNYFTDNVVEGNHPHYPIIDDIDNQPTIIKNCIFTNNEYCVSTDGTSRVENCVFDHNKDIAIITYPNHQNTTLEIVNTIFSKNMGGAICIAELADISNCLFYENHGIGGISTTGNGSFGAVFNSIFDNNVVREHEGKAFYLPNGDIEVRNCISTTTDSCDELAIILDSLLFTVDNPDGTIDSIYEPNLSPPTFTCENIVLANNPLFVDPENGDFHLLPNSQAINAGYNPIIDSLGLHTDFEGDARVQGGIVDIGPDEVYRFSASIDSLIQPSCAGSATGAVSLSLSGMPPYTYFWENGGTNGNQLDGLLPGYYQMTITDANDDIFHLTFNLPPVSHLQLSTNSSSITCAGAQDGRIIVMPSQGIPPFTYLWTSGDTTAYQENISAGIYQVTVTDSLNCTATTWVELFNPDSIHVDIMTTDASCFDSPDGTAVINIEGGTPPYSLNINDPNHLTVGTYTLIVADQRGCSRNFTLTIGGPDSLSIETTLTDASTEMSTDGSIQITQTTGGVPPYSYQWSTGYSGEALTNLSPGTYTLTITDGTNCERFYSFEVSFANALITPEALGLSIQLSPNPVVSNHTALLSINSENKESYQMSIFNNNGKLIKKQKLKLTPGKQQYRLPIMPLSGLYYIYFENNKGQFFVLELSVL